MKLTWKGTNYGQVGFHVELHEYDATPPVTALLMDHAPLDINREREAIAAYLAFGHWISGDLQLPHPLGPNTAAAIEADGAPVHVRPSPIEYYPKPLERGVRDVSVVFDAGQVSEATANISVLPTSQWSGALRGFRTVSVASNAFTLDAAASNKFESIRARLAIAVLYAAELSADKLLVPGAENLPRLEKDRISDLLQATRLGVEFV